MKKVLIICPTSREYRYLPKVADTFACRLVFEEFAGSYFDDLLSSNHREGAPNLEIPALIEETARRYEQSGIAGVTSGVGYPGMPVSSIIAKRLGLPGPPTESVLLCEHKYYSRMAQRQLVPEAVPGFHLVDPRNLDGLADRLDYPLFLKPVKSCFSINADVISNPEMFRRRVASCLLPEGFLKPLNDLIHAYTDFPLDASYLLAESLLEGTQVSLEGYVFEGCVHILGIVDSVMYPGTISFRRFEYPSRLSEDVQKRMERIAETFISGIGYDNALFNIEFMYNAATDRVYIIEINPKIASQFTDLFEKVDGASSYRPLLEIALGHEPVFPVGQGAFKVAASCVLRTFDDKRVLSVPSAEQVEALMHRFPDARVEISASRGKLLSDIMQDGKSFRYGLINIGADSWDELDAKFELCKSLLDFKFEDL
ncbi:MAG TPA: ATP-grasp domain-containing protein [Pyrinomonadaceae bacterium]|nr:ATP-grasp domain-containing protein [Pyrinomonadaceae bacterium]